MNPWIQTSGDPNAQPSFALVELKEKILASTGPITVDVSNLSSNQYVAFMKWLQEDTSRFLRTSITDTGQAARGDIRTHL